MFIRIFSLFIASVLATSLLADRQSDAVIKIAAPSGQVVKFGALNVSDLVISEPQNFNPVTFNLDDEAAKAISALFAKNVGNKIKIFMCDELISEPVVLSPIFGPRFALTGFSPDQLRHLDAHLNDGLLCSDVDGSK